MTKPENAIPTIMKKRKKAINMNKSKGKPGRKPKLIVKSKKSPKRDYLIEISNLKAQLNHQKSAIKKLNKISLLLRKAVNIIEYI